ncbi:MAG: phytanoyl-CoA dioxygenase family protein [Planctomycetota bacterium]
MIEPRFTGVDREAYLHDGYMVRSLFSPADLEAMKSLFGAASSGCGTGFYTSLWSDNVDYRRTIHEGAREILRRKSFPFLEGYRMCLANFAVKVPGSEEGKVPLHQDWSMTDESRFAPVTIWCPLSDVDEVNGCLTIVPGSHRICRRIRANFPLDVGYSPIDDIAAEVEQNHVRRIPMHAGEGFVYNPGVFHGSQINRSDSPRVALVAAFIPEEAPLLHYYQTSKRRIEVYEVSEDFYWRDVVLGEPPTGQRLVEVLDREPATLTVEQIAALAEC